MAEGAGRAVYRVLVGGLEGGRTITETLPTLRAARAWRDSTRLDGPIVGLQRAFYEQDSTSRGGEGNG